MSQIASALKTRRRELGLSVAVVAARAGVSQSYLSHLEAGDRANPELQTLMALARVLGVPVGWLLGEDQATAEWQEVIRMAAEMGVSPLLLKGFLLGMSARR